MKFVSWNVNGFRAVLKKGFDDSFRDFCADIFALQETKAQPDQIEFDFSGYKSYFNSADKKGYSGTGVATKLEPIEFYFDFDYQREFTDIPVESEFCTEGRVITLEFPAFFFVTVYTPNAQRELTRLSYRLRWENAFLTYIKLLDEKKPVVICGDMNVAHNEIDLKNPKSNRGNAGFTDEEREKFSALLDNGFIDTFRYKYPDARDAYSWWSYMGNARAKNVGWRIDYFLVSDRKKDAIIDCGIMPGIYGSDHCPVFLEINMD
ncbi:MAG: exodeoxyribonuclease III [Clostridia bacterium]